MAIPTEHTGTIRNLQVNPEVDSAFNLPTEKSGGHQRWRKIFKRAVSGGPQTTISTNGLLAPSSRGSPQLTTPTEERRFVNGTGRNNGNVSSTDTHIGNLSLSTASLGDTAGDGSASSVHLPLTPNQAAASREYPLEGPYSTSTERSSGSSGVPLGSPLPQTAKSRYFAFAPSSSGGHSESVNNSRTKGEKKDKYRTLGRKAGGSAKDSVPFYSVSSNHSASRNQTIPVATDADTEKSSSATQRFIRRVASAPNAKGLFSAGSMFNKNAGEPPLPSKMTGLGLPVPASPTVREEPSSQALGLSNVNIAITQSGSDSPSSIMATSPSGTSGAYPARHPIPRLLSGSSNLTPGASTSSLVSTSTGAYSIAQSGAREHRAQSVGTAGRSAVSPGMARLGAGPGPGFRRTYSSNSIKSKTVSLLDLDDMNSLQIDKRPAGRSRA